MTLNHQDLAILQEPFKADEHELLRGFVYLKEESISNRLEQVDPAFSFVIKQIETRANAGEGGKDVATVHCVASLTLKGATRENVGMAVVQRTEPKKDKDNQLFTTEANEAEKAATTDAFKRAARLFGVGRYILSMGKIDNDQQIVAWLNAYRDEALKNFFLHWTKEKGFSQEEILSVLGVAGLREWNKSIVVAHSLMERKAI